MSAVKGSSTATIQEALLNPTYPRTIRIVMNRNLSIQKYTDAIVEALEPRMKGKDLEKCVRVTCMVGWAARIVAWQIQNLTPCPRRVH